MSPVARAIGVMAIAVVAMSWAAPLIRLTAAPPLAVAAWRVALAMVVLAPFMLAGPWRTEWRGVPRRDRWLAVLCAFVLALHFASWITSLRLTSVAASSVLVSLSPVFAWLLSARMLGERPTPRQAAGIVLAVAGAAVIALGDARGGGRSALLGDALALLGAASGGLYFVIGRRLRGHLSLAAYVTPVYGLAALVLLGWAAARGEAFGPFVKADWLVFAGLALGPMVVGHTGLNFALRYMSAWQVNVAELAEPAFAIAIAWLLPAIAEVPRVPALAGGALALTGIALALGGAGPPQPR